MVAVERIKVRQKVKSGCSTCKIRKIKCDEGRPACLRCISTGRECDGYGIWGGGTSRGRSGDVLCKSNRILCLSISPPPSLGGPLSTDEARCLDWFRSESVYKLPGAFLRPFFQVLLIQGSATEPAIRHAMFALSSCHQQLASSPKYLEYVPPIESTAFTLTHYNKAITSLSSHTSVGSLDSLRVITISCITFVLLEYLQGHYRRARLHLEHGLRLWKDSWKPGMLSTLSTFADNWISGTLRSLQLQSAMYDQLNLGDTKAAPPSSNVIQPFKTIYDARACLDHILLDLVHLRGCLSCTTQRSDADISAWRAIKKLLSRWLAGLLELSVSPSLLGNVVRQFACTILKTHHTMGLVMLDTCLDQTLETRFDKYTSNFLFIVEQAAGMMRIALEQAWHKADTTRNEAISDIGPIAPLYYTALKCRVPRVRRAAIALLEFVAHKEGVWDARIVATVAKRAVEIEERAPYLSLVENVVIIANNDPEADRVASTISELPSEQDRIRNMRVVLPDEPSGWIKIHYTRIGASGARKTVEEMFNPQSPDAGWIRY